MIMGLITASSSTDAGPWEALIADGSSFVLVAAALGAAWRVYLYAVAQQREREATAERRLAAQRSNVHLLLTYLAVVVRLVPDDVDVPVPPQLRDEHD